MLYGLNFNGSSIPAELAKLFKPTIADPHGSRKMVDRYRLQGIATSQTVADMAVSQASNGRRRIHVVTNGSTFAIYCN